MIRAWTVEKGKLRFLKILLPQIKTTFTLTYMYVTWLPYQKVSMFGSDKLVKLVLIILSKSGFDKCDFKFFKLVTSYLNFIFS